MTNSKNFTKAQVKKAIDESDYTYQGVADYLALHVSKDGRCSDDTAKKYIEKYGLESYLRDKTTETTRKALKTIRTAIERGDTKTSKWWVERILREKFGNEIVVHNENKEPLNINFENFTLEDLLKNPNAETAGYDKSE